jgi:hypothetical protein
MDTTHRNSFNRWVTLGVFGLGLIGCVADAPSEVDTTSAALTIRATAGLSGVAAATSTGAATTATTATFTTTPPATTSPPSTAAITTSIGQSTGLGSLPATQGPPPTLNTVVIPPSYIQDKLSTSLLGTEIQVSHTTGDTEVFPSWVQACQPDPAGAQPAAVSSCIATCNTDGLTGKALVQCRAGCRQPPEICTPVCGTLEDLSFIQWGELAKLSSQQNAPDTCSTDTCPACSTPTAVPSLHDQPLSIPVFTKVIDPLPGIEFTVTCRVNQWRFKFLLGSLGPSVTSAPTGLTVRVPGTTGSPAIPCDNASDISAHDVALELTFHPTVSWGALAVSAEGGLDGSLDGGLDGLFVDVDAMIKGTVHTTLAGILNGGNKPAVYADMFNGLIVSFLNDNGLPALTTLESVSPTDQGLQVQYF